MILRPYQDALITDIRAHMRKGHKNVLAVLPTGGGKTVIASFLAGEVSRRAMAIYFICHRDFLVHQTALTFERNGLDFGFIAAGRKPKDRPVQICSIDTLKNRLDDLDQPGVIVWDEAHHLRAAGWEKVRDWAGPDCFNIGLTATPERLDGKGLNPPFTEMAQGPSVAELMELGSLSDYRAYAPGRPDMTGVNKVAGDYSQGQMAKAVRESVIMGDIVGTYQQRALGKRFVYFCPDVAYSKDLAAQFRAAGINSLHIDGDTPRDERVRAARMFADGDLDILTNCSLFGEGYDLAAQAGRDDVTIEGVGLVRPTQSLALHFQQIGRALRPKSYPAILLDHAGNIEAHGLPDDPVSWNLFGRSKEQRKSTTKVCPHCYGVVRVHLAVCDACGVPFPQGGGREGPEHVEGELEEVDKEELRRRARIRRDEERACRTHEDFIELGRQRGYHPKWAHMAWKRAKDEVEAQARAYLREYA